MSIVPRETISVPSPLQAACNTPLYYYRPPNNFPWLHELCQVNPGLEKLCNQRCVAALRIIFTYCMRANEYLSLTTEDILPGDRVVVHGSKGSASFLIYLPDICDAVTNTEFNPPFRSLSGCTYIELYRTCCKLDIGQLLRHPENKARTHLSRHQLIDQMSGKVPDSELSDLLRHKSPDSISYYGAMRRK